MTPDHLPHDALREAALEERLQIVAAGEEVIEVHEYVSK
jgi:hypothetical protein